MTGKERPVSFHSIQHTRAPLCWEYGFPLGNGDLGVMMWGDGNPLKFTLDKADLWDLRSNNDFMTHPDFSYTGLQRLVTEGRFSEVDEVFEQRQSRDNPIGPTKISIGRAELRLGDPISYDCHLDLSTATVDGVLRTAAGEHQVQAFVHRNRNVFCLRVTDLPEHARMELIPLAEMNDCLAKLNHPAPRLVEEDDILRILSQSIPDGPCYVVVWNVSGPDFFMSFGAAESEASATSVAKSAWHEAADMGLENLHQEHTKSWDAFWDGSAVYLPEQRVSFLWHFGLYLLSSSSRRGSVPPGLQGLWPMDGVMPPWRGDYHADMNVQETFWPAFASGHLELADNWCDLMHDAIPAAQEFTRRFFGTEGTFLPCCTLPNFTSVPCWHTVQFAWSHSGWLGWLVWLRWRYSMDKEWLESCGYPVISEIFRFYRANLRQEVDGHLHVPLSSSPEYRENKPVAWCKDPNIDLALIRRCCDWVVEMEEALGVDALRASARDVRARLVPYSLTANQELCLWPDKSLEESHRHPSHLMPIHPAMDLTTEDGEDARRIIDASLEHYFSLGQYRWAGHTYAQMASLAAVIGRSEFAFDCLHQFAHYWIGPNGLHFNRDTRETGHTCYRGQDLRFTMESSCAISAGISDMLVQGWRDIVRVFPAVPEHWKDIAFRHLLTEGAFRVSALRADGETLYVRVVAGVDRALRLPNPFAEAAIKTEGGTIRLEGNLLIADLKKGQGISLWRDDKWCEGVDFHSRAMPAMHRGVGWLGLR